MLANGRTVEADDGLWRFTTTPPIPPALFVVCAGPWHSMTWEHAGLPFGWHARRSLAAELERDAAELRRVTEACFDHYAAIFEEPYPFDSFDQAFVPGQNWGAQEMPGCVTYRDELLPVGRISEGESRGRTTVIAHEMAHMWFGDLVTMTWWEDTWLQESFADYLGYRVGEDAAGLAGNFVDFTVKRKTVAYAADERRSTHPVAPLAEEVPDVDAAANNFDQISYAKGNSVLRQLVTWLGDDDFLAGVNAYLTRHRFGNATLADFVEALSGATDRDVRAWVESWLRTTGFDTLRVVRDDDGPFLVREGSRPHRVRVTTYDESLAELDSVLVDVADEPVRLPDGAVVVPNSGGETFARIRLDAASWEAVTQDLVSIADDGARAVLWATAFDLVRCGELPADEFLGLVTRHLPREPRVGIVEGVLDWTATVLVPRHVAAAAVGEAVAQVAAACEAGLASEPDPEVALALTRGLASPPRTPSCSRAGWSTGSPTRGSSSTSGCAGSRSAGWRRWARSAPPRSRTSGTATARWSASSARRPRWPRCPDPEAKAAAWARMFADPDVSNRVFTSTAAGVLAARAARAGAPLGGALPGRGPGGRHRARTGVLAARRPVVPGDPAGRRRRRRARSRARGRRTDRAAPVVGGPAGRPQARAGLTAAGGFARHTTGYVLDGKGRQLSGVLMFQQDLDPVGGSLALSALCAAIPLVALFVLLGGLRIRAWVSGLIALGVALVVAVALFEMPLDQALLAGTEGAAFGFFPIMWIVVNAIWVYNLTVSTGHFDVLRRSFEKVSPDQRIQAIIIAFCFGALLEALAGFGTPVAITVVMLMALGFQPLKAAVVALVANTAPVAFGALATPIVTLATVTSGASDDPGLTVDTLGAMVGRQTPLLAAVVPLILVLIVDGRRGRPPDLAPGAGLRRSRSASPSSSPPTTSPCRSPTSWRRWSPRPPWSCCCAAGAPPRRSRPSRRRAAPAAAARTPRRPGGGVATATTDHPSTPAST